MIRSIIVEDDAKHSERLRKILKQTGHFVEVLTVCDNIDDAIAAIEKYSPELVFLDIRLRGNDNGGFDLLNKVKEISFEVIFTTAHIDDNISEIRRCGLYYLAKPYISDEIDEALKKYEGKQKADDTHTRVKSLKSNLLADKVEDKVIYINVGNDLFPIRVKDILYCFSKDSIMTLVIDTDHEELKETKIRRHSVTTGKPEHENLVEWEKHMTMTELEADLSGLNFCRVHNKYLVNMLHVKKFISGGEDSNKVKLTNGETLAVSASGKKEFMKFAGRR